MPTIDANKDSWDKDWGHDGSDWSQAWGSSDAMWRASVHARIGRFLPADSILEIAPGRGRLSAYLIPECKQYLGIDLAQACVDDCRKRFDGIAHARFETTDGTKLAAAADESVDFAFSWDSLVHADANVLQSYVAELRRVLRPGSFAFLHHSNLHSFVGDDGKPTVDNPHWRDHTVSAGIVRAAIADNGMHCRVQELIQWGVDYYNDCFTLFQKPAADAGAAPDVVQLQHPSMNAEMQMARSFEDSYWRQ